MSRGWIGIVLLLAAGARARADVFVLKEGDRVTGTIAGETPKAVVVKSAYGVLTIPRDRILRVLKPDGSDRVLSAPTSIPVAVATPIPPPPLRLVLSFGGTSFWHAWEDKNPPQDPTVRLAVSIDESIVATYADSLVDAGEIKGAILNAFGFNPAQGFAGENGAKVSAPNVRPGKATLNIELASVTPGEHTMRLSYQVNEGFTGSPSWRDVSSTSIPVNLKGDGPTVLRAQQEQGKMSFEGRGRKEMKNVESFRVTVTPETS